MFNLHTNGRNAAIALCVLNFLMTAPAAFAETTGTLYITTNTVLSENHAGDIVVVADGATLDCAGHTISGNGLPTGILLDNRTNVTVKNCQVVGFVRGMLIQQSSGNTVIGNTANHNDFGSALAFSPTNQLVANTANRNRFAGIAVGASSRNTLNGNTANLNGRNGFEVHLSSDGNLLIDNTANNNAAAGIAFNQCSNNRLSGNVANNNGTSGFELANSHGNGLRDGTANRNGFAGFALDASSNNSITANIAKNNDVGLFLTSSSQNTIHENNMCPNKSVDAVKDPASIGNAFGDNFFCTTHGL